MIDTTSDAVIWLRHEVKNSLADARQALEQFAEDDTNLAALKACAGLVNSVRGALRIAQADGATMLASEILRLLRAFYNRRVPHRGDALDALARAMMQLPSYLDRIAKTGRDVPLVILPLVNDLRAARGATLMSEDTIFAVKVVGTQSAARAIPTNSNQPPVESVAIRLRPSFQESLLGLMKAEKVDSNLGTMGMVADAIAKAARQQGVHQLFWVASGMIEALRSDSLAPTAPTKRVLGQLDQYLSRLASDGEIAITSDPPTDLLNSMLYYVARSPSKKPRINEIRQAFALEGALPSANEIQSERDMLSGPSDELLMRVGQGVQHDIGQVKDALDLYLRRKERANVDFPMQAMTLRRVSQTLGLLGLNSLRLVSKELGERLAIDGAGGKSMDDAKLSEIAERVLWIEQGLKRELDDWTRVDTADLSEPELERRHSERQVEIAVLRECLTEFARVRNWITVGLNDPAAKHDFDKVPESLHAIFAALWLAALPRVADLVRRLQEFIGPHFLQRDTSLPSEDLNALADVIVGIEIFLEMRQRTGRNLSLYLDQAEATLGALENRLRGSVASTPISAVSQGNVTPITRVVATPLVVTENKEIDWLAPIVAIDGVDPTPDSLELFIEETRDLLDAIEQPRRAWRARPDDREALGEIRRTFHTLKGSGMMVGARPLSEASAHIEDFLNRVLVGTLLPQADVVEAVDRSVEVLAELVEQIEIGTPPKAPVAEFLEKLRVLAQDRTHLQTRRADKIAKNNKNDESGHQVAIEDNTKTDVKLISKASFSGIDLTLAEIFSAEAKNHLSVLLDFLNDHPPEGVAADISEPLERALHTLRGSAQMAGIVPIAELTEPLHKFVQASRRQRKKLEPDVLKLLGKVTEWLQTAIQVGALTRQPERTPDELLSGVLALKQEEPPSAASLSSTATRPGLRQELRETFAEESQELLDAIDNLLRGRELVALTPDHWAELKRLLHTLKGGARMVDVQSMADIAHALETYCERASRDTHFATANAKLFRTGIDQISELREMWSQTGQAFVDPMLLASLHTASETALSEIPRGAESVSKIAIVSELPRVVETTVIKKKANDLPHVLRELSAELESVAQSVTPRAQVPNKKATPTKTADDLLGQNEYSKIDFALLDELLSEAGEVGVVRGRLEQQVGVMQNHLGELGRTVARLREQLRAIELESESRVSFKPISEEENGRSDRSDFDPLELDRYSRVQQLSRSLSESMGDLLNLHDILQQDAHQAESLLVEQSRVTSDMQEELIQARMVPVKEMVPRLERLVRKVARDLKKEVELIVEGDEQELDRQILKRMVAPLEHMLRNALVHGIEDAADRMRLSKDSVGHVYIRVRRERSGIEIEVSDDGAGLNVEKICAHAVAQGRLAKGVTPTEQEIFQWILQPGFTTATELTQDAGRGIGMDVVASEVKQLGGRVTMRSVPGEGTTFLVRLPASLAVTQAVLVRTGNEIYALPMHVVKGIQRIANDELRVLMQSEGAEFVYSDVGYRLIDLAQWLGAPGLQWNHQTQHTMTLILVESEEQPPTALIVDGLQGSREIVVKPLTAELASLRALAGATILADGQISLMLDVRSLLAAPLLTPEIPSQRSFEDDGRSLILVVDDSITVRRVTQRLLERNNMRVITAKDGVDAIALLRDHEPDLILLDIEMPRMDGYEVAAYMRNDPKFSAIPIIMITSRGGDKHRARAFEVGVDAYLGKPYQESQLLATMHPFLDLRRHQSKSA